MRDFNCPPLQRQRERELGYLGAFWPHEVADQSVAGRQKIIDRLEAMARAERQAENTGRWHASVARHTNILICLRRERALLKSLQTPVSESANVQLTLT